MTSKKKKPRGGEGSPRTQPERPPEGYRPFTALRELSKKMKEENDSPAAKPPKPPAPSRLTKSSPPPRDDDEELTLHRMMSGVTPLGAPARRIPRSVDALPSSQLDQRRARAEVDAEAEAASVHAHLRALVEGGIFEVEDDGHRAEGRRAGVPAERVRQLRRGLLPIDGRLDLHGLGAGDARAALERFLGEQRARGESCVLVVHGKGAHSPGGHGVLRGEIAAWLSQGSASVHVAAFSTARPEDGGEGAVYVLLVR